MDSEVFQIMFLKIFDLPSMFCCCYIKKYETSLRTLRLCISRIKVESLFSEIHFNYQSNISDQVNSSPGTLTKARYTMHLLGNESQQVLKRHLHVFELYL